MIRVDSFKELTLFSAIFEVQTRALVGVGNGKHDMSSLDRVKLPEESLNIADMLQDFRRQDNVVLTIDIRPIAKQTPVHQWRKR